MIAPHNPAELQSLCDDAVRVLKIGDLPQAERLFLQIHAAQPGHFFPNHMLGLICAQQGRFDEALNWISAALSIDPSSAEAHAHCGNILKAQGHLEDAVASYNRALAIRPDVIILYSRGVLLRLLKRCEMSLASFDEALALNPDYAEAWNGRGNTLCDLNRFEEALESFDKSLAIKPGIAENLHNRGNALQKLLRHDDALASYDAALAIRPQFADALSGRGVALRFLKHFDEALISFDKALALDPELPEALGGLAAALCDFGRVEEGLGHYRRLAELSYSFLSQSTGGNRPTHKTKHDEEQHDYLSKAGLIAPGPTPFHLIGGNRLANAAVNSARADIADQWRTSHPQIVVIDDFLTPEALDELRRFCWGSTIWQKTFEDGYLGAMAEHGFACPLLAQIVNELRSTYPDVFHAHPLRYLWAFKYDSRLNGIGVHADEAAVNVNFWITPDDANLDPDSGGVVIWDVEAPLDWDFAKFNGDTAAIRDFLTRNGAKSTTIPYRANRAVIFDSNLFHETDKIVFKDGYLNRRINVTLLYGGRGT